MVIVMLEIGTVAGSSDSESDWAQQEPASPLARCSARGASLSPGPPWEIAASLRLSSHQLARSGIADTQPEGGLNCQLVNLRLTQVVLLVSRPRVSQKA